MPPALVGSTALAVAAALGRRGSALPLPVAVRHPEGSGHKDPWAERPAAAAAAAGVGGLQA